MKLSRILLTGILAVPAFLLTGVAHATPVTGIANIAGNVDVTATSVLFAPNFVTTTGATETGSFTGLTGGTIMSLFNGPQTGDTNVPGFIQFTMGVATPVTFDLTYIAPGVGTLAGCSSAALGSSCTPTNSPFTLFQLNSNTVIASLQLNGMAYTGSASTGSSFTRGIFSTQTALNGNIPMIIQSLQSGQTLSGITYSASFQAEPTVPEPASMLLMGLGLAGAGLVARRKAAVK